MNRRNQRFRVNYFLSNQQIGACFRVIPADIPAFRWAEFPEELAQRLAHFRNGLVLISGVAGSGKTTTLAMIINLLNREGGYRIITVEEPIEYVFSKHPDSVVTQREVGVDVHTFADGLKYGLRQDPDIMLVGEIRDRETAQMALSVAETGHLVFSHAAHAGCQRSDLQIHRSLPAERAVGDPSAALPWASRRHQPGTCCPSAFPNEKRVLALEILFNNRPDCHQRNPVRQAGIDRQQHPDGQIGRHAAPGRVDQTPLSRWAHHQGNGRTLR